MSAPDFFARFASEFADQTGSSQENVDRQVTAERLVAKAEYELLQLRRALVNVMDGAEPQPVEVEEIAQTPVAARAA
ncbi:MAG: hypothetical protein GY877_06415 [Hyphomicrobium sp.]|nr:hypothetical protein [Hyphomicrobium sp.]